MAERARQFAATYKQPEYPTPLFIVDFLQLIGGGMAAGGEDQKGDGARRSAVARAAYAARGIARELGLSVLVVSSTARANYQGLVTSRVGSGGAVEASRGNGKRTPAHPAEYEGFGKEAGEIEYAADTVTVLTREERDESKPGGGRNINAALAKNRHGARGWAFLHFNGNRFELQEVDRPAEKKNW